MHRPVVGVTLLEHELTELRLLIERQTGILLDCPNSALAAHVADYLERHELESPAALLQQFRAPELDSATTSAFLDGVLNVNTGFFRHPGAMNTLARQVLPQISARKSDDSACTLRIWSAGCSTGEEAYSIAMALCDALSGEATAAANGSSNGIGNGSGKETKSSGRNGGVAEQSAVGSAGLGSTNGSSKKEWSIHIVGTDLLPSSIQAAERGIYPQSALTGLPPAMIRASFSKAGASGNGNGSQNGAGTNGAANGNGNGTNGKANVNTQLLVKPRLRSMVTFNTMNLTKPVYIGRFDCIFCMDVLPHLSRSQRGALIERLHLYLEPGGCLFLSQTEKLFAPNLNFRSETFDGYTYHRKPVAASGAYGR
jgi:chemotaxis methyl-accepting protein methylase